jgi:hypothetical protein
MRRPLILVALALALSACHPAGGQKGPQPGERDAKGFPAADRPVAKGGSSGWSSDPDRDAADESGQLIRGLGIEPGMAVADIGAGSGYHTLRLSPAVGPTGVVYAEDIVRQYLSGLEIEAERRHMTNVKIVVGRPDDPGLPPKSVDRAVMVHMYNEIQNPYALLWNLVPSLRPGAQVGVIDVDRPTQNRGTPPSLLKCEFEAVGYHQVDSHPLEGGVGYLSVFEPPPLAARPKPSAIQPCMIDD